MNILLKYDGRVLTEEVIEEVEKDLIRIGLYRPMRQPETVQSKWRDADKGSIAPVPLNSEETELLYHDNIQDHKEAGFPKGWPSRFDTQFKLMKVLGFVYYEFGEKIIFSDTGRLLAETVSVTVDDSQISHSIQNPQNERMAFLNAFSRHQRGNPFIRELNRNIPLILLLQTITLLDKDPEYNGSGIAYHELPLLLFWKDDNAEALYRRIKRLRTEWGYTPSDETIEEICTKEILGGYKKFKLKSITDEYPDDFVRKMRLTGLISLRGGGRFIDINRNEDRAVEYLLTHYKDWYHSYSSLEEYFEYAGKVIPYLEELYSIPKKIAEAGRLLPGLSSREEYEPHTVIKELMVLSKGLSSKHPTLRFIPAPARLEFLTALAIFQNFKEISVSPNYPCDDEGLPLTTAGSDKGDIECIERGKGILVEVTMAGGRTQTMMEAWPVGRHLEAFARNNPDRDTQGVFVAPSLYPDTIDQFAWLRDRRRQVVRSFRIADFVAFLEKSDTLFVTT